jgi:DNA repair protein RadC
MKYTKTITSQRLILVKEETDIYPTKITSSKEASEILRSRFDKSTISLNEEFHMLMLSRSNQLIGHSVVGKGGYSGVVADLKMIFAIALKNTNAHGIILCHNHPSGQLKSSEEDRALTKRAVEFGKMIDLPILDHIILTEDSYYSFADNGLI